MSEILAYARRGREFEVMDELARLGIEHWRGTEIRFERRGKNRTAEGYEYPALPCYIWIRTERFDLTHGIPNMCRTVLHLTPRTAATFHRFRAAIDAKEADARKIMRMRDEASAIRAAISEYKQGEAIEIRDGVLAGHMARFKEMVERSSDLYPKIRAEVELMGRPMIVEIDPLSVRRAV